MTLAQPWMLLLLLLLPLVYWGSRRRPDRRAVVYSDLERLKPFRGGKARWMWIPRALFWLAAAALVLALARPQLRNVRQEIVAPGIDIVLALDMSSSMLANDFPPNRFEAARRVLKRFIASRTTDRVGLVVFAGRAYTQVPLTFDYRAVSQLLDAVAIGQIEDGTAIGMGLVEAVNRLKDSPAKSRIVILLTDGVNNRGKVDPDTAGEIAKLKGIRVYTIGMGTRDGGMRGRIEQMMGLQAGATMDVELMQRIAGQTGGRYFEAASLSDLSSVYDTIGSLEKSEVKLNEYVTVREFYPQVLALALVLLLAGWLLELTVLRRIP